MGPKALFSWWPAWLFVGLDHGVNDSIVSLQALNIFVNSMLVLDNSNQNLEWFYEELGPYTRDWAQWDSDWVIAWAEARAHISPLLLRRICPQI